MLFWLFCCPIKTHYIFPVEILKSIFSCNKSSLLSRLPDPWRIAGLSLHILQISFRHLYDLFVQTSFLIIHISNNIFTWIVLNNCTRNTNLVHSFFNNELPFYIKLQMLFDCDLPVSSHCCYCFPLICLFSFLFNIWHKNKLNNISSMLYKSII